METEVKEEEMFEDFEAHEQVGIECITSKDFNHPSIESETFRTKIELKTEVKEEAFTEFNLNEQIGMDFITSEGFETSIQSPVKIVSEQIPSLELDQMKTVAYQRYTRMCQKNLRNTSLKEVTWSIKK